MVFVHNDDCRVFTFEFLCIYSSDWFASFSYYACDFKIAIYRDYSELFFMIFVFQALRERQRFRSTVIDPTKFNPICVSSISVHKLTSGRASRYNGSCGRNRKFMSAIADESGHKDLAGRRNSPRYPPRGICSFSSTCFFMMKLRFARSKSVLRVQANAPTIIFVICITFIKLCSLFSRSRRSCAFYRD